MKKILSLLFSFILLLTCTIPAFAAPATQTRTVTNEYEALMELYGNSTSQLKQKGYTNDEIQNIKNFEETYNQHILKIAKLDPSVLSKHGYTLQQIQKIKNFNPTTATTEDKILLSATCETTSFIDEYTGTTGRVTTTFEWTGIPAFKMTDILATAWNNWYITGKSANIEYVKINNPNDTFSQTPTYKKSDTGLESFGASYYFPAAERDNYYYARSGSSIFVLGCESKQHLETAGRLGHQEGVASLSVSIRGGLDISFSVGRKSLGNGYDTTKK